MDFENRVIWNVFERLFEDTLREDLELRLQSTDVKSLSVAVFPLLHIFEDLFSERDDYIYSDVYN